MRTLVLGGTRSGKSAHAEGLLPAGAPVRYLATARRRAGDVEWDARLDAHRARRSPAWPTAAAPAAPALGRGGGGPRLGDDRATWRTHVLDDSGAWDAPVDIAPSRDALVSAMRDAPGRVVLVSAEVGLGVVPATRAGRLFRDELGALNAALAAVCDEVLLLVAGLALRLK